MEHFGDEVFVKNPGFVGRPRYEDLLLPSRILAGTPEAAANMNFVSVFFFDSGHSCCFCFFGGLDSSVFFG